MKYGSLYERLVANTVLAVPDNMKSCWLWQGKHRHSYPRVTVRTGPSGAKTPRPRNAVRVMLEEILNALFPHDEAGHLCYTPLCINPDHLEVQTSAANLSQRRGYADCKGSWIPVLYPREDTLQALADFAFDNPGSVGGPCPF